MGKHGRTIVDRNRLRRRLRELVRLQVLPRCKNVDMTLRALPTAYEIDVRVLMAEVKQIAGKLEPAGR